MTATAPKQLVLRAYQVGFGDCFLLRFEYTRGRPRHVLVDFGSTKGGADPVAIANDIAEVCEGKLDMVVATHRHKDHISGFATKANGKGSGDIIRALEPDYVIQPWTEHPDAKKDARSAPNSAAARMRLYGAALEQLHQAAGISAAVADAFSHAHMFDRSLLAELAFIGEDNLANKPAVENLMTMASSRKRQLYVSHARRKLALGTALPGVDVRVLGPPTLEQTDTISKQRSRDADEFWHLLQAGPFAAPRVQGTRLAPLFPGWIQKGDPSWVRWTRRALRELSVERVLSIVRELDKAMNNTSVVLLMQAGKKKLLFPGDAQIENWEYALGQAWVRKLLAGVDLYKVGHHGSLNATPKSLFELFDKRASKLDDPDACMTSVMSTKPGVHGSTSRNTEVPRRKLADELEAETHLFRTDRLSKAKLCEIIEIPLR
jgi:hypothetical protein